MHDGLEEMGTRMMVKFLDLKALSQSFEPALSNNMLRVIKSGRYLLGSENKQFEENWCKYVGSQHAVLCANGLDALKLILRAYKKIYS
jgi:dTDP-4-amino-4,6-dideoxygalactose transaminase